MNWFNRLLSKKNKYDPLTAKHLAFMAVMERYIIHQSIEIKEELGLYKAINTCLTESIKTAAAFMQPVDDLDNWVRNQLQKHNNPIFDDINISDDNKKKYYDLYKKCRVINAEPAKIGYRRQKN
ncbi:MAG: hypothetical protein LBL75_04225 [Rickettsiales bacterium]|jgi:hypothetical protein|nr:hypothetical protein [Rickettsiales bacterium]